MLWKKRQDYLIDQSYAAADAIYGQTARWEITREFPIESIYLVADFTAAAFATTKVVTETWYNIIKRVTLTVADGSRTRNVIDASGSGLAEYARQQLGGLDRNWMFRRVTGAPSAGAAAYNPRLRLMIPIFFALPQISDPLSSALLLPAHRYNANPVLTVTTEAKANVHNDAGTTTAATLGVVVNRREVQDPNWEYYDTELFENPWTPTAGLQSYDLPIPGAFTGMQIRATSSGARVNPCSALAENRLQYLGNVIRRWRMEDIQRENELSTFWNSDLANEYLITAANTDLPGAMFTDKPSSANDSGLYYMDFLTDRVGESVQEIGSALETNFLMASGARVQWLTTISGTPTINILFHRIMGDISKLKFARTA
ncbi:MAG: hypothetical protein HY299_09830 [Verrucomicrobia bacterium]|nr:hypothetical protein [Verrucomicrobiota bacterium]